MKRDEGLRFRSTTHYNIPTYASPITAGGRLRLLGQKPFRLATPEGFSVSAYSRRAPTAPGSLCLLEGNILSLSMSFFAPKQGGMILLSVCLAIFYHREGGPSRVFYLDLPQNLAHITLDE